MKSKIKVLISAVFLAILPICLLCSCADSSDKTVNWLLSQTPVNLDPQTADGDDEIMIIKNCFCGLFEKDKNGNLVSSVVEHYDVSKDGLKYVFYLKDDIYWSITENNGIKKYAKLTAQDFVFAIQRVFTDNPDADCMRILKNIKNADKVLSGQDVSKLSVKENGKHEFTVILSQKTPAFTEVFSDTHLFPCNKKFFLSTSGRYGLNTDCLIFNGSFCVWSWKQSYIMLSENKFSAVPPKVKNIRLYTPKDTRDKAELLKNSDIDAAVFSSEQAGNITLKDVNTEKHTSDIYVMIFNPDNEIWKDKNLRQAVITCTDRSVIEKSEHYSVCSNIVSRNSKVFSKDYGDVSDNISAPETDFEKAKLLYTEGIGNLGISSIYNTPVYVADTQIGKDIFSSLNQVYQRELSLYFSPEYLSKDDITEKIKSGDFAAAVVNLPCEYDSPEGILKYFSDNYTVCLMSLGSDFSSALSSAVSAGDYKSAVKSYNKCENILFSSGLISPIIVENSYFISLKNVSGFWLDIDGSVIFNSVVKK